MTDSKREWTRRDVIGTAAAAATLLASGGRALAQGKAPIKFAALLDLTKIYTFVSVEYNQGQKDYNKLLNLEGGIDGHPVELIVRDHASEPQRGIALYNQARDEGAVMFDFLSTPVSLAMVPRVLKDHVPMLTLLHGRGDAIVGDTFPYVFPASAIYWSQAAALIKYIGEHGGGLKGKKIAFVYMDTGFGREPLPLLKILAEKEGFNLQTFPYAAPGTEQAATWTSVRRAQPDSVLIWGAGPSQAVSVRQAISNGIPVKDIYSVVWLAESDIQSIGASEAVGLKRFTAVNAGTDTPILKAIVEKVINPGLGSGDKSKVGNTYYNLGVMSQAIPAQAAKLALAKFGAPLTGEKLKNGFDMLKEFNAQGLTPPITITAADHQGGGWGRITEWNGKGWTALTDWGHAYQDVVWQLAKESASKFKLE